MTAVIIIFNTDRFLTEQIRLLQKHVTDKIAVVDNSTDYAIADNLKAICEQNKVEYLKIFCDESDFSKSHAYACTIAINFYREKDEQILLLDHDIFPVKPFDKPSEETILAGIPQIRKSAKHITNEKGERYLFTYLWPGLLYINCKLLADYPIDIKPCIVQETFLDTGGGLYKLIMGNPDRIKYYNEHYEYLDGEDNYSIIEDSWMHFRNGSAWKEYQLLQSKQIPQEQYNRLIELHSERIDKLMSILYANS